MTAILKTNDVPQSMTAAERSVLTHQPSEEQDGNAGVDEHIASA